MIQDGGEEASAHGAALAAFARGGVAADEPAVQTAVSGLLTLSDLESGRLADAARIVARLAEPPSSDEAWVPYYRRGDRSFTMAKPSEVERRELTPAEAKKAVSGAKNAEQLHALAASVAHDPDAFAVVDKASRLKKWTKQANLRWIIAIRCVGAHTDEAIELLETLTAGRFDDAEAGRAIAVVAEHLQDHPDRVDLDRSQRIIAVTRRVHPQFITRALTALAGALVGGVATAQRESMIEALLGLARDRYKRIGDQVYVRVGIAWGLLDAGLDAAAEVHLQEASTQASTPSLYFKGPALAEAIAGMRERLGPKAVPLALAAMIACTKHEQYHYAQVMQLERALRYLWRGGDVEATIAMLGSDDIPTVIRRDVQRSIWADIEHAPEPLRILEAAWPSEALPPALARECLDAAVVALRAKRHPQLDEVVALVEN